MRSALAETSRSVQLDANGNGSVSLGPTRAGEHWDIANTVIYCTGDMPTNGDPSLWVSSINGVQIDFTYSVQHDASGTAYHLGPGQTLFCQWTNGPASGVASVAVVGTRTI